MRESSWFVVVLERDIAGLETDLQKSSTVRQLLNCGSISGYVWIMYLDYVSIIEWFLELYFISCHGFIYLFIFKWNVNANNILMDWMQISILGDLFQAVLYLCILLYFFHFLSGREQNIPISILALSAWWLMEEHGARINFHYN